MNYEQEVKKLNMIEDEYEYACAAYELLCKRIDEMKNELAKAKQMIENLEQKGVKFPQETEVFKQKAWSSYAKMEETLEFFVNNREEVLKVKQSMEM